MLATGPGTSHNLAVKKLSEPLPLEALFRQTLAEDLDRVRSHIEAAFVVEGQLMGEVAAYVGRASGKMLRPALVSLASDLFGYDSDAHHDALLGAAIELFHTATLLHDDVIDKAPVRRGQPTVNAKWGDDVAILFADYLYATSFDYALEVLDPEVVRVLSKTTQRMTEGEMLQIERRGTWLTVDDYHQIIKSKTAYLFSASTGLGAMIAGAKGEDVERLFAFGLHFGMAFQITDDALDYEAQGVKWGKRVGADLKEGKQTLPLLLTLERASEDDRAALLQTLSNGRDFETVHGFVKRYRAIEESLEQAAEHTRKALEALEPYSGAEPADMMRRIADGVVVRQY